MISNVERKDFSKDVKCCDEIVLKKPTLEYLEDIIRFRQEILDAADRDSFAGCIGLDKADTEDRVKEWIKAVDMMSRQDTCPKDKVPSNMFIAVRLCDNKIVGAIDLRHHINNPILSTWGGHMGYSVRLCERRKGYAVEMLRQNLLNCKKLGIERVMITCNRDNTASEKTILANGGVFEKEIEIDGEFIKRFWIEV